MTGAPLCDLSEGSLGYISVPDVSLPSLFCSTTYRSKRRLGRRWPIRSTPLPSNIVPFDSRSRALPLSALL